MIKKISVPRVMISATGSNCGKTTMMLSLLSALRQKKMTVQSFKSGPDYIDPMFHSFITQRKTYHTDAFFSDKKMLLRTIAEHSSDSDISIIEGAMGFYDGIGKSSEASAYTVASLTNTPVILILNPQNMGISVAAIVKGYLEFRENNNIKGVILNRVKPSMYSYYKDIIESETNIKVCGYLPELEGVTLKSRHLGLMTAAETDNLSEIVQTLGEKAAETLDTDLILNIAASAEPLEYNDEKIKPEGSYRLGIARDKAFCFYYEENLDMLEQSGAELVYFSPTDDEKLPDNLDGLYFGGGYPELYLEKLSSNHSFIESLKNEVSKGIPVFAECGGFMYLQKGIYDKNGDFFRTAGILDGTSELGEKLCRFGYITVASDEDTVISRKGMQLKAHEFHYSDSTENGSSFTAVKPNGKSWKAIVNRDNITAGYPHIFFPSEPETVRIFSRKCIEYGIGKLIST